MINRHNYLSAKAYLTYLAEVAQLKASSIGRYWSYLRHLLLWADEVPFDHAPDIRPTFSQYLASVQPRGETTSLASPTLKKMVNTTKRFFGWAKVNYPAEFRSLPDRWVDALRPPRTAEPAPVHVYVTLDEVLQLASLDIDETNLARRRDQAAAAFLYISGMRAGAFGSLPLAALDVAARTVNQWPSLGVKTKNGKAATTYLLEIPELIDVVARWDTFIRKQLPPGGMWYTPTLSRFGRQVLSENPSGKNRNVAVAKRMRKLFAAADLPYKSPHKFRHGHAVYALQHAQTMADYKAVSMNLMHEDIRVTDGIYAILAGGEVRQRIAALTGSMTLAPPAEGDLATLVSGMSQAELSQVLLAVSRRLASRDTRQVSLESPVVGRAGASMGLPDIDLSDLSVVAHHLQ
ncbi:MAG: site-specific integrase [Anaerolineae bacterium]|nr:site-specific integrase [Anaerolineae bacterium]